MRVSLYLAYYDYYSSEFDADDSYYGEGEYANAINEEFIRSSDAVDRSMKSLIKGSRDVFMGTDGKSYSLSVKPQQNEDKVAYSRCDAVLYDEDGSEETVDGLISKFVSQGPFIEMVELDIDSSDEDFETECSIWKSEHDRINSYIEKTSESWVAMNEPKRNLKMSFTNNAGEDVKALLVNCKIMDVPENGVLIIYVEKMTLIDSI